MADRDRDASERQRTETPSGSRYVERDREGRFKDNDSVGRAAAGDQRREAENENPRRGQGNRGDREDEFDEFEGDSDR